MYFKFYITLLPVLMINLILMRIRILDPHWKNASGSGSRVFLWNLLFFF